MTEPIPEVFPFEAPEADAINAPVPLIAEGVVDEVEQELAAHIATIPVPEDAQVPAHVYQHLVYRATHDRGALLKYARFRMYANTPGEDADDVVQNAFLKIVETAIRKEFTFTASRSSLRTLYTEVGYRLMDSRGGASVKRSHEVLYSELPPDLERDVTSIDADGIEGNDLDALVTRATQSLSYQRRRVYQTFLDHPDLKSKEAAALLGMDVDTYRTTKSQLFALLRRKLTEPVQRLNLLLDDERAKEAAAESNEEAKAVSGRYLQANIMTTARRLKKAGEGTFAPVIPHYIGQWAMAARLLATGRKDEGRPALVVYPHPETLLDFSVYLRNRSTKNVPIKIVTPDRLTDDYLKDNSFDHVAVASEVPTDVLERLMPHANFLIQLFSKKPDVPVHNLYETRSYAEAGGREFVWTTADSIRYLQEWRFTTGALMTEDDVRLMAAQGQGPSLGRLCYGVDNFMTLQAFAGYPFGPVEVKKY